MKNLIIDCIGGTGNRLGNILLGYYLRDQWSFERMFINWQRQFSCDARFGDCFKQPASVLVFDTDQGDGRRAMMEYFDGQIQTIDEYAPRQEIAADGNYLLISKHMDKSIPPGALPDLICQYFPEPIEEIQQTVSSFISRHGVNSSWRGVHCRRTDRDNIDNDYYLEEIGSILKEDPTQRFIVCSDCSDSERLIHVAFPENVIYREKRSQPVPIIEEPKLKRFVFDELAHQRLLSLGWNDEHYAPQAIRDGKEKYNIYRSRVAVQEGLCDLLILGGAGALLRSVGSYYRLAKALIEARK